jgi:hypothetical protein
MFDSRQLRNETIRYDDTCEKIRVGIVSARREST